jgi:pimeloyl-ACP methyl ester carboxylesterase
MPHVRARSSRGFGRAGRIGAVAACAALLVSCSGGASHSSSPSTSGSSLGSSSTSSALSGGAGASTAPAAVAPNWAPCKGSAGPSGYQCATILVPRDPTDPAKGEISMALDRRPATGNRIGSLLVNPGGPGASGVDFLPSAVALMPSALLDRFDIVGFDPPGVDRTAPIDCADSSGMATYFHTDPAPTTPAGLDAMIQEFKTFAAGCEQRSASELPYVSTTDAAMDMDVIRRDVGDAQLTYFGFSYGTYLGATYAGLYPTRIRAMVLDGAEDPSLPVVTSIDQQSQAIESNLMQMFDSCTGSASCPWHPGPDPLAAYEALAAKVRTSPLSVPGTSRTVGPAELLYGTAAGLYATSTWSYLETALAQASAGNGTDILRLFDIYTGRNPDGSYSNEFEANAAVNCLDAPAPSISTLEADAPAAKTAAPVFGVQNLYSEMECAVWPVPASGHPAAIRASGSPPILVVGSTGDPATPYSWAQGLAAQLDRGFLLTRTGDGHTGYPYSTCVRNYVDKYLTDLTLPPAGTRCPSTS